jgi:hypothetical protein
MTEHVDPRPAELQISINEIIGIPVHDPVQDRWGKKDLEDKEQYGPDTCNPKDKPEESM